MNSGQHNSELWNLLEGLCEDRLGSEETVRLEEILSSDPAARNLYFSYINLHGSLHWDTAVANVNETELQSQPAASLPTEIQQPSRNRITSGKFRAISVVAGVLLLASLIQWWGNNSSSQLTNNATHSPTHSVAESTNPPASDTLINPNLSTEHAVDAVTERKKPHNLRTASTNPAQPKEQDKPGTSIASTGPSTSANNPQLSSLATVGFINSQIRQGWQAEGIYPSEQADDAEWLRRVSLDIVGHIPPVGEAEAFIKDRSPAKRAAVVERLLDDPDYVRNWTSVWTSLLIGRSENRDVNRPALQRFLREAFARNRPWNKVVYDLVSAEGASEENGATNFLLAHLNNEAVPATAITARLFLGIQVQCTQCHDHPFNDWKQNQFWEFNSFFNQTITQHDRVIDSQTGKPRTATELVSQSTGGPTYFENRNGLMKVAFPAFEGHRVDPGEDINRRQELATLMTGSDSSQVAQAIVNRMWAHFFGYGFTRSVDDMGPHNPPTHPELLEHLSQSFIASGYDLKQLMRWICQSEAYQLSSAFGESNEIDSPDIGNLPLFSRVYLKSMTAEQLYDSLAIATSPKQRGRASWADQGRTRDRWLQQFIFEYETEENDEATNFQGTISQALMMMNSDLIESALSQRGGTYLNELLREEMTETEKIEKLCLSALSRYPTKNEIAAVRKLLRERAAQLRNQPASARTLAMQEGLQDVFWAYLNSNEFLLVH